MCFVYFLPFQNKDGIRISWKKDNIIKSKLNEIKNKKKIILKNKKTIEQIAAEINSEKQKASKLKEQNSTLNTKIDQLNKEMNILTQKISTKEKKHTQEWKSQFELTCPVTLNQGLSEYMLSIGPSGTTLLWIASLPSRLKRNLNCFRAYDIIEMEVTPSPKLPRHSVDLLQVCTNFIQFGATPSPIQPCHVWDTVEST